MDQNLIPYIKQQLQNKQNIQAIRCYLVKYYPEADVNAAINIVYSDMQKQSLKGYVQQELKIGYSIDAIKEALFNRGYSAAAINEAINAGRQHPATAKVHVNRNAVIFAAIIVIGIALVFSSYFYFSSQKKPVPKLLDVNLELISEDLYAGDELQFSVAMSNFGSFRGFDVSLKYDIMEGNTIIATKAESLYLESSMNLVRKIKIPKNAAAGSYMLAVNVSYDNHFATAQTSFDLLDKERPVEKKEIPARENNTGPETKQDDGNEENRTEEIPSKKAYDEMMYREYIEYITAIESDTGLGRICLETAKTDYKDQCFVELAIRVGNDATCGKINETRNKDICYRAIALQKRALDGCDKIENSASRETCIMVINAANMFDDKDIEYMIDIRNARLNFNMTEAMEQFVPA